MTYKPHFLVEQTFDSDIQHTLTENENGRKEMYIEGIFMQGDRKNRNGRIYPAAILENQMKLYSENFIKSGKATGELDHPNTGPKINTDRISHLIVEMRRDGSDFFGKAKLLNTPMGNIARGLIEGGVQLGVSTRGLGTVKESNGAMVVQEDFILNTVDIVSQPSAHDAWVTGIMESAEWVWNPDTQLVEKVCVEIKEEFERKAPDEAKILEAWTKYIQAIK